MEKEINQTEEEDNFNFDGREASEEIILHLKRHPMTMYRLGLALVGGGLLVVVFYTIFGASLYSSLAVLAYLVIGGYFAFKSWYLWWASHYLLTTERVISIDQKSFFNRIVSESLLENIMNVYFEIEGPYQTFLNYGTVSVIASGKGEADVEFLTVPSPYDVQQAITEATRIVALRDDEIRQKPSKTIIR